MVDVYLFKMFLVLINDVVDERAPFVMFYFSTLPAVSFYKFLYYFPGVRFSLDFHTI